ncbi:MAG: hypothetical protein AB1499_08355 [Nitrospirota bacterium]
MTLLGWLNLRRFFNILVPVVILMVTGGCSFTHTYKQPIHNVSLPTVQDRINLRVKLELSDDLLNSNLVTFYDPDRYIVPMGENLSYHSIQLVKNVFTDPIIPGDNVSPEVDVAVYILTPKIISATSIRAKDAKTTIVIEWSLSNKSTGKTVWVETVSGEGSAHHGVPNLSLKEGNQTERFEMALRDLFEKSQSAMLSSNILRKLSNVPNTY